MSSPCFQIRPTGLKRAFILRNPATAYNQWVAFADPAYPASIIRVWMAKRSQELGARKFRHFSCALILLQQLRSEHLILIGRSGILHVHITALPVAAKECHGCDR